MRREGRLGASQVRARARSMGLIADGRTEEGWAKQKKREEVANAAKTATEVRQRAEEQTAAPEHASLDAQQATVLFTMVSAMQSVSTRVPLSLYDALELVRPELLHAS